jgi:hypothetical protein
MVGGAYDSEQLVIFSGHGQASGLPANNPLHQTGSAKGRAMFAPSAMSVRLGCSGAYVRHPVSRERPASEQAGYTPLNVRQRNDFSHGIRYGQNSVVNRRGCQKCDSRSRYRADEGGSRSSAGKRQQNTTRERNAQLDVFSTHRQVRLFGN